jgi:hypothetical protein
MIKSVVREFHWPPEVIGGFFIDDQDYKGLEYWYDDVREINTPPKK